MRICFVLPGYTRQPIGGFKMVYEYSNQFINRGHQVSLLCVNENVMSGRNIPRVGKRIIANFLTQREPCWFNLDDRVKKISGLKKASKYIVSETDIAIATSVDTAKYTYEKFKNIPKAYFIQDYENWSFGDDFCRETYKLGMKNIVISKWLKNLVASECGIEPEVIRNPIDIGVYKVIKSITKRDSHTIGLLYHKMEHKGLKYSFEALYSLKELYPDLQVKMFGVPDQPNDLPDWFEYHKNANRELTVDIYNSVSIWMCSTIDEGYGLTGLEAMACGAALVSTAYQGVFEYAQDGDNCLLSPVKDVKSMICNVDRLFKDDSLRICIAKKGVETAKKYSIDKSVNHFIKIFESMQVNNDVKNVTASR